MMDSNSIQSRIFTIRSLQVMVDSDLAEMYEVETKYLTRAVSRNIQRFPEQFRFQLTQEEFENLRCQIGTASDNQNLKSQIVTSSRHGGRRTLPYVFTEQGVSMLSAVLRSDTAIKVSIQIMDAFVGMRKFIANNAAIFQRLDSIEQKQYLTDTKLDKSALAMLGRLSHA
ncbi:MAG: ORF6N domain-containing protein [Mariprofundaceae bacterium]|nr:ORF6N domain-containing protein [Mariprofundaceae bacterium]